MDSHNNNNNDDRSAADDRIADDSQSAEQLDDVQSSFSRILALLFRRFDLSGLLDVYQTGRFLERRFPVRTFSRRMFNELIREGLAKY